MELITSSSNSKIKLAASLLQRKYRDKLGLFLVEGLRNVELLVQTGKQNAIVNCFITEKMQSNIRFQALLSELPEHKIILTSESVLSKISEATTPQGILVIMEQPCYNWQDFSKTDAPILILDRIMDPGNVGTIIRTADALGAGGIIGLKGTADFYAPKVIRSAMGSIFAKPIMQNVAFENLVDFVIENKIKIYLADLDDKAHVLPKVKLIDKIGIILGNEANGIDEIIKKKYGEKVYIPMVGNAESLNVAMATAIIMYEYQRQLLWLTD